jgi:MOSC domain-containing protein YiiM
VKEVNLPAVSQSVLHASFHAALSTILELGTAELPDLSQDSDPARSWTVSRWLGGLYLGLVPVADARTFTWPGPWLARVQPPEGAPRFVVMYGVPSGVVWDPAGDGMVEDQWIQEGFVVAAADIALARPPRPAPPPSVGTLEQIYVASAAGEPAQAVERARALPDHGLEGDRHATGRGTFPSGLPGSALTLIEAEVCESFDPPLSAGEHRRNLITRGIDLNGLVGSEFVIGATRCRGMRLCEPCTVVARYASRPVLRALVHRGGLRADILTEGEIQIGDHISVTSMTSTPPTRTPEY